MLVVFVVICIFMAWDFSFLGSSHPIITDVLLFRALLCFPTLVWLYYCSHSNSLVRHLDYWIGFTSFTIGLSILYNIYQYGRVGFDLRAEGLLLYTFLLYIVPGCRQKLKTLIGASICAVFLALAIEMDWPPEKLINSIVYLIIFNIAGSWHSRNDDTKTKTNYSNQLLLKRIAETDQLTGLYNRHGFDERLAALMERAESGKAMLAVIILDIDYFKAYNDNLGHLVGDRCLMEVSKGLQSLQESEDDIIVRFGGEEFLLVFYQANGDNEALNKRIEQVCPAIESLNISHPASVVSKYVTVSAGACLYEKGKHAERGELMLEADTALYKAKSSGRNQFVLATE